MVSSICLSSGATPVGPASVQLVVMDDFCMESFDTCTNSKSLQTATDTDIYICIHKKYLQFCFQILYLPTYFDQGTTLHCMLLRWKLTFGLWNGMKREKESLWFNTFWNLASLTVTLRVWLLLRGHCCELHLLHTWNTGPVGHACLRPMVPWQFRVTFFLYLSYKFSFTLVFHQSFSFLSFPTPQAHILNRRTGGLNESYRRVCFVSILNP